MCKAPKPPKPKDPKKPQFLRNRYLDEFVGDAQSVKSLKSGRSSLRIPLASPSGTTGTPAAPAATPPVLPPAGNGANVAPPRGDFRPAPIRRGRPGTQLR